MKARCSWCGGGFIRLEGTWWCQTPACAAKQAEFALAFQDQKTGARVPFYVPLPKQIDYELAPVRYLLGGGAAGASKSHVARYALYRRALAIPDFEALILRKTWGELEKHHLRLMDREARKLKALGLPVEYLGTAREFRVHHPGGGVSVIEAGHMENPEDIEKYLSRERDAIVADEGSTFDPQKLLELSTRARTTKPAVEAFARRMWNRPDGEIPGGGAVFWVLSNPGGPAAPMLRDFFIDHTPNYEEYPQLADLDDDDRPLYRHEEWGFIKGDLEDNPYLPPSYERDLAMLPPWRYQQLRYGNWDVLAGQFFMEFDARTHVKDLGTPRDAVWFRAIDYGFIDPMVCLWFAVLPDGRIYVRKELKRQYCSIPQFCQEVRQITKDLRIGRISETVGDKFSMGMRKDDTSGEKRGETFSAHGVSITATDQDRVQGWTRVREYLAPRPDGLPGVVIHPTDCRYLIRTLASAVSSKNDPEDIDKSCDDHALDPLRMGLMSRPAPRPFRRPPLPRNAVGHMLEDVRQKAAGQPQLWR